MRAAPLLLVAALVGLLAAGARADTPAQCLYPDFEGPWKYYLGKNYYDNSIDCTNFKYPATEVVFNLTYPDVVVSGKDTGFWTRIYNQGAEIVINGYKYFAFSSYEVTSCEQNNCTYTSVCNTTFNGWYHDLQGNNWGCFFAVKQVPITGTPFQTSGPCNCSATPLGRPSTPLPQTVATAVDEQRWQSEAKMVSAINAAQLTWSAAAYPEYTQKTVRDMTRRAGGRLSRRLAASAPARPFDALLAAKSAAAPAQRPSHPRVAALPVAWDWTNVSGQNFVSPVRDQGDCGSCYAFSTMGMLEARIRLATRNTQRPVLSPQNIVSCSEYSQGCEGGFPYLVSKYGEDFQQVSEQCFPYANTTPTACTKRCNQSSQFFYDTNYYYVGGYFGACNEAAMMEELYYSGPVAVSFEVYQDFFGYKGGVYTHQNSTLYSALQMNPFEVTNHAVLLVGYGEDNGVPFWKVKNSWGTSWGEQGFFRILRGVNECAIEEMALAATPVGKKQH